MKPSIKARLIMFITHAHHVYQISILKYSLLMRGFMRVKF